MSRKATAASNTGNTTLITPKHTGRERVQQLAEWTAHAEPFGRAEQYGEHEQQEAQTITTVGWIVFADAGDGAYQEPNARGIASRIFFHNGSGSTGSGWTLVRHHG